MALSAGAETCKASFLGINELTAKPGRKVSAGRELLGYEGTAGAGGDMVIKLNRFFIQASSN